jgi:hypothetical protein
VATRITANSTRPIRSAPIAPNPLETPLPSTQQGVDTISSVNNSIHNNNTNINIHVNADDITVYSNRPITSNISDSIQSFSRQSEQNSQSHQIITNNVIIPEKSLHTNTIFTNDSHSQHTIHTNNVDITENAFNIDIDINQAVTTHNNNHNNLPNIYRPTTAQAPITQNSSNRTQYLISQFFKPICPISTRPHQGLNNINNQISDNDIRQHHIINHNNTDHSTNDDINNDNTPTNTGNTNNILVARTQRQRKHYVQHHLLKKPIANFNCNYGV